MPESYSPELVAQVKQFLDSQGWAYEERGNDDERKFEFRLGLSGKINHLRMEVSVGFRNITVIGIPPISADAGTIDAVAKYFTFANYVMKYGSFDLDYRDGELRFKSSLFCGEAVPALDVVAFTIILPFRAWQQFGNALLEVIIAGKNPADAFATCDGQSNQPMLAENPSPVGDDREYPF